MTFREQVSWCGRWGIAAGAVGVLLSLVARLALSIPSDTWLDKAVGFVASALVFFSAVALLFGVVLRSAHRWMWFNAIKPSTLLLLGSYPRDAVLGNVFAPFWWWWLHVDREGKDLDGLH